MTEVRRGRENGTFLLGHTTSLPHREACGDSPCSKAMGDPYTFESQHFGYIDGSNSLCSLTNLALPTEACCRTLGKSWLYVGREVEKRIDNLGRLQSINGPCEKILHCTAERTNRRRLNDSMVRWQCWAEAAPLSLGACPRSAVSIADDGAMRGLVLETSPLDMQDLG